MNSLLVSDPFPEPKSSLPVSIIGSRYGEPLKWEPRAKIDDPSTVRREKTKTPTREKQKKKYINLNRHAEIRTKAFFVKKKKSNLKICQ